MTGGLLDPANVRWGADGLAPAIAQDAGDGRVLMLGYMDREALTATLETGEVHFHSRSRGRLWRKGETSGNTLRLRGLALDCDGDALLLEVEPQGPTCHRGTRSCFDPANEEPAAAGAVGPAPQGFAWLETVWATIVDRAATRPPGSYTARLLEGGVNAAGRKVVEEATELLLAAKDDAAAEVAGADRSADRSAGRVALAAEAADLLYHTLVLLAERDVTPAEVVAVLRSRHAE
ncbi:MAG TPA: bifunctional phosphoribosyl-AMP cyclohydrolase/phosphoribosyl-ATP diphosphatase HisIE [Candidatus Limnocylindria bacterium]|nr:bifunctional phosphoribosyl-AMP cyclohydrolase/phosphoribosyl-ATP diphosphatase HisIE [Candidatus Limnocylindria bacterium]